MSRASSRLRARNLISPVLPTAIAGVVVGTVAVAGALPDLVTVCGLIVVPIVLFAYWQYVGAADGLHGTTVRHAAWVGARLGAIAGAAMGLSATGLRGSRRDTTAALFWAPGWHLFTIVALALLGATTVGYRASRARANSINRSLAGAAEIDGPPAEPPVSIRFRDRELVITEPVWCRMVALFFTCVGAALMGAFAALESAPLATRGAMIAAGLVTILTALDYVGTSLRRCQSQSIATGPLIGMIGFGTAILTARLVGLDWLGPVNTLMDLDGWQQVAVLMVALLTQLDISQSPFEPPAKHEPDRRSMTSAGV